MLNFVHVLVRINETLLYAIMLNPSLKLRISRQEDEVHLASGPARGAEGPELEVVRPEPDPPARGPEVVLPRPVDILGCRIRTRKRLEGGGLLQPSCALHFWISLNMWPYERTNERNVLYT